MDENVREAVAMGLFLFFLFLLRLPSQPELFLFLILVDIRVDGVIDDVLAKHTLLRLVILSIINFLVSIMLD